MSKKYNVNRVFDDLRMMSWAENHYLFFNYTDFSYSKKQSLSNREIWLHVIFFHFPSPFLYGHQYCTSMDEFGNVVL